MMTKISIYLFLLILVSTLGCDKKESDVPLPEVLITSDFYFDGTIDEKRITIEEGSNNFLLNNSSGCSVVSGCGCCKPFQSAGFSTGEAYVKSEGKINLQFIDLRFHQTFNHELKGSEIDAMFEERIYPYSKQNGVVFRYLDQNMDLWGSDEGDNSNSYMEITNIIDDIVKYDRNSPVGLHKIIEVRFNCTLYRISKNRYQNQKEKIRIENGKMRVRASRY